MATVTQPVDIYDVKRLLDEAEAEDSSGANYTTNDEDDDDEDLAKGVG